VFASAAGTVRHCASLVSGLFVGLSTGLFVAKLSSRTFDLPQWELIVLTTYAVLQAVFPVLTEGKDEYIGYGVVIIALYAKIVLLVIIEWMRDQYRIQYYMLRARQIWDDERESKQHEWFAFHAKELYEPPGVVSDSNKIVRFADRDQDGSG